MKPQSAPPSTTKRAAIYTRKSVAKGLEMAFNSLDAQYEACRNYIQAQPGWVLVDERYDDGGFSGGTIERPAFQQLLADVEDRKVDIIVVYKVDRLSRSLLDFASFMQRLSAVGASFVAVTQNFSTADAMGRLTLHMLMSFAEFERSMISERTRDKIHAARKRGIWGGGIAPFGYERRDKRLYPAESEALVIRTAFELLLEHQQPAVVARLLNVRGLFPRGPRLPTGKHPRWNGDAIGRVLRNVIYVGKLMAGDELCQGEQAAIVDQAIFDQAQAILATAGTNRTAHGINPEYVLRRLLRCGSCGAAMTPASTRRGGAEFRYYVCSRRNKSGGDACAEPSLPAEALESYVVERIGEIASDKSYVAAATDALDRRLRDWRAALDTLCRTLPGRIASISVVTSRITEELLAARGPTRAAFEAKLTAESEKLAEAQEQLAKAQRDRAALEGVAADAAWVTKTLADFTAVWDVMTLTNRGRLLRALIDHVVVDEPSGRIEIHLVDFDTTNMVQPTPADHQEAA